MTTTRLAIVTSHVIQYQDPLFKRLAAHPELDLTVIFCSRHGAETYHDADMGVTVRWDLDLLTGYRHLFLRNLSPAGFESGFFRLINPGIVTVLRRERFDAVLFMMGWGSLTAWLGMLACMARGIPFYLFGDSSFPPPETTLRAKLRHRLLARLFARAAGFMTSGVLNAAYYEHYGADRRRFHLLPWAVDNDRFAAGSGMTAGERSALRAHYGIAPDAVVIVFSGKLIARKDPLTLLRAFERMPHRERAALVFMGNGELREPLTAYAAAHGIGGVHVTGFVNQSEMPRVYGMSDLFVLPSTYEPRGSVINEAMASGLPVVVTDRCGAIGDIVLEGDNAFIYPAGDAEALAVILERLVTDEALRARMAARSRTIIDGWSYEQGVVGVVEAMRGRESRSDGAR